jgi:hypothetical protein
MWIKYLLKQIYIIFSISHYPILPIKNFRISAQNWLMLLLATWWTHGISNGAIQFIQQKKSIDNWLGNIIHTLPYWISGNHAIYHAKNSLLASFWITDWTPKTWWHENTSMWNLMIVSYVILALKRLWCTSSLNATSANFWWALNIEWDTDRDLHDMITDVKRRYSMDFIMEIIIIGCWALWDQGITWFSITLDQLYQLVLSNSKFTALLFCIGLDLVWKKGCNAPCLFLHHLPCVSLHFVAFLCDFQN